MSTSSARNENSAKLQAPGISPPAGLRDPAGEGGFSDETKEKAYGDFVCNGNHPPTQMLHLPPQTQQNRS